MVRVLESECLDLHRQMAESWLANDFASVIALDDRSKRLGSWCYRLLLAANDNMRREELFAVCCEWYVGVCKMSPESITTCPQGIYAMLGMSLQTLGRAEDALRVFMTLFDLMTVSGRLRSSMGGFPDVTLRNSYTSHPVTGMVPMLNCIAKAYMSINRNEEAEILYNQALKVHGNLKQARSSGDSNVAQDLVDTCTGLASLYSINGRHNRSIAMLVNALEFLEKADQEKEAQITKHGVAQTTAERSQEESERTFCTILNNVGQEYAAMGRFEEGVVVFRKILEVCTDGDRVARLQAYSNLGKMYSMLCKYAECVEVCRQALELVKLESDASMKCNILGMLGKAYTALLRFGDAEIIFHEALKLGANADIFGNLAIILRCTDRCSEAADMFQKQISLLASNDLNGQVTAFNNLAATYADLCQPWNAIQRASHAIALVYVDNMNTCTGFNLPEHKSVSVESISAEMERSYRILQTQFLLVDRPELALAVADQSKTQAWSLSSAITAQFMRNSCEHLAGELWTHMGKLVHEKNYTVVEYSYLENDVLVIWVLSSDGKIKHCYQESVPSKELKDALSILADVTQLAELITKVEQDLDCSPCDSTQRVPGRQRIRDEWCHVIEALAMVGPVQEAEWRGHVEEILLYLQDRNATGDDVVSQAAMLLRQRLNEKTEGMTLDLSPMRM